MFLITQNFFIFGKNTLLATKLVHEVGIDSAGVKGQHVVVILEVIHLRSWECGWI